MSSSQDLLLSAQQLIHQSNYQSRLIFQPDQGVIVKYPLGLNKNIIGDKQQKYEIKKYESPMSGR